MAENAEELENLVDTILGDESDVNSDTPPAESTDNAEEAESKTPTDGDDLEKPEGSKELEDEFEIVLEGDEEPAPQKQHVPKRVRKLLERKTELETELKETSEASAQEIANLKAQLNQTQVVDEMPLPPNPDDFSLEPELLVEAQAEYKTNFQSWLSTQSETKATNEAIETARNNRDKQENKLLEEHYERADSLKIKNYDENEEKAAESLGQNMVKSIAMMLPNSAMVINYLGANPAIAEEIAALDKSDPRTGVAKLWELNFKLKAKPRKRSKTPDPESKIESSAGLSPLERQMEKAAETGNIGELRRLKKEAREKGIKFRKVT